MSSHKRKYPCKNNCGTLVAAENTRCKKCYLESVEQNKLARLFHCPKCGKPSKKKITLCQECRIERAKLNKPAPKVYLCRSGCGTVVKKFGMLCQKCANKRQEEAANRRDAENNQRIERNRERF